MTSLGWVREDLDRRREGVFEVEERVGLRLRLVEEVEKVLDSLASLISLFDLFDREVRTEDVLEESDLN